MPDKTPEEEIDRFCVMVEGLIARDMDEVLCWACMALGQEQKRTDRPWSDNLPYSDLYQPYEVDDLRERLTYLIDEKGVMSQVVIDGLFSQLVSMFEHMGNRDTTSDVIDNNMELLKQLEDELSLPLEERRRPVSDDTLRKMIAQLRESFGRMRPRREECERIAAELRKQWADKFSTDYWCCVIFRR